MPTTHVFTASAAAAILMLAGGCGGTGLDLGETSAAMSEDGYGGDGGHPKRCPQARKCAAKGKVLVCHVPPGNPDNAHEICIGAPAVPAHLEHHDDYLGCCVRDGEKCPGDKDDRDYEDDDKDDGDHDTRCPNAQPTCGSPG